MAEATMLESIAEGERTAILSMTPYIESRNVSTEREHGT